MYTSDYIIPGRANCYRQSIPGVRQSELKTSTRPSNSIRVMAMATSSQSGSAKKVPMTPSEFFAKIYGGADRPPADASAGAAPTSTANNPAGAQADRPSISALQQQHHQPRANSAWHLYPPWNADQLFWASGVNQGSFFNPLSLPPALTALSTNKNI